MTERVKRLLAILNEGEYKKERDNSENDRLYFEKGTKESEMCSVLLSHMLSKERPKLLCKEDRFGFNRTVFHTPIGIIGEDLIYKNGSGNATPNYEYLLSNGMCAIEKRIEESLSAQTDENKKAYLRTMQSSVRDSLAFADRYRDYAKEEGFEELYSALCRVPRYSARSFFEACVFLKFIQFTLRCNRNCHITLGGFDKYMYPFFEKDLESGMSEEELFEILEEFFITLNLDSDTYFGIQKGDNGMSMVLGGRDMQGNDRYNRLSELIIKASIELSLIDPKINLRVDKSTPMERIEFATELTKKGLGFPQYCNDDVVIPGLLKLGYAPKDAFDYTVAACWEFIVPGSAFDIPNRGTVNFPLAMENAVKKHLASCDTFDEFLEKLREETENECLKVVDLIKDARTYVSPYLSVFFDGCIENATDVSDGGAIYTNYGAHGAGISTAADSAAAIKMAVFEEKVCTKEELINALEADFEGYAPLRNYLLSCPKMGNNDERADMFASFFLDIFADVFSKHKNFAGGVLRAGTGSAHEYIYSAALVGATPDGKRAKAPFASSFSPSPIAKIGGPLSCIQSFTKHDLTKVINGGPLTMEIHDNTFRNPMGIKKVAALVKAFIDLGGHQLQINAVNRERLQDAKAHPENHKNLIVRVWGWSGYFTELSPEFQDHIISRNEFMA